jgi:drug/metabolite transporter (DMT)-like permease
MFPSFLTTIFFSLSALFGSRSARMLGPAVANLGRMGFALLFLGLWAHTMGQGLRGPSLRWFLLSGFIGYGLGDLALFQAFTRIGPRLTMLIVHCLAVPLAAIMERIWLGTTLRPAEIGCIVVILTGVFVALTPVRHFNVKQSVLYAGIFFGVCASMGQAGGAVVSRKANAVAALGGMHIDGGTAAYQRMIGGIALAAAVTLVASRFRGGNDEGRKNQPKGKAWMFVLLNAIAGPTLGVACFQWALSAAPSGVVLPIVATTPVVTIPLAYWIDGDRPTMRSIVGGVIAVAGTVLLAAEFSA